MMPLVCVSEEGGRPFDPQGRGRSGGGSQEAGGVWGVGAHSKEGLAIKPKNNKYNLSFILFGLFPAKLGPETRSNGSGSKNGAERT